MHHVESNASRLAGLWPHETPCWRLRAPPTNSSGSREIMLWNWMVQCLSRCLICRLGCHKSLPMSRIIYELGHCLIGIAQSTKRHQVDNKWLCSCSPVTRQALTAKFSLNSTMTTVEHSAHKRDDRESSSFHSTCASASLKRVRVYTIEERPLICVWSSNRPAILV